MSSKTLVFVTDKKKEIKVIYKDGLCTTSEALTQVFEGNCSWKSIETEGDTLDHQRTYRYPKKTFNPDKFPEFLGYQNVPKKIAEKPVVEGEAPKKKGKRSSFTAEMLEKMKELSEAGKTIKETAVAMEVSYAVISVQAKKNDIKFKAGVKGKKKTKPDIDPEVAKKIEASTHLTTKDAAIALGLTYAQVFQYAKAKGLKFKAGMKGFQKGHKHKRLDKKSK